MAQKTEQFTIQRSLENGGATYVSHCICCGEKYSVREKSLIGPFCSPDCSSNYDSIATSSEYTADIMSTYKEVVEHYITVALRKSTGDAPGDVAKFENFFKMHKRKSGTFYDVSMLKIDYRNPTLGTEQKKIINEIKYYLQEALAAKQHFKKDYSIGTLPYVAYRLHIAISESICGVPHIKVSDRHILSPSLYNYYDNSYKRPYIRELLSDPIPDPIKVAANFNFILVYLAERGELTRENAYWLLNIASKCKLDAGVMSLFVLAIHDGFGQKEILEGITSHDSDVANQNIFYNKELGAIATAASHWHRMYSEATAALSEVNTKIGTKEQEIDRLTSKVNTVRDLKKQIADLRGEIIRYKKVAARADEMLKQAEAAKKEAEKLQRKEHNRQRMPTARNEYNVILRQPEREKEVELIDPLSLGRFIVLSSVANKHFPDDWEVVDSTSIQRVRSAAKSNATIIIDAENISHDAKRIVVSSGAHYLYLDNIQKKAQN